MIIYDKFFVSKLLNLESPKRCTMGIEVNLTTARTIAQGQAIEGGKNLDAYRKAAGIAELDPADMEKLGAAEGDTVKVVTQFGEVLVSAVRSKHAPHKGTALIPLGPWANTVMNPDTSSTGMPFLKNVPAVLEVARGEKVLNAQELVRKLYSSFKVAKR